MTSIAVYIDNTSLYLGFDEHLEQRQIWYGGMSDWHNEDVNSESCRSRKQSETIHEQPPGVSGNTAEDCQDEHAVLC